ncbi:MAG: DUF2304 domain-containing protein [Patescibacteria group bacterium]
MIQQIIAGLIIIFFLIKLLKQWRKKTISFNEFIFWLLFWILALLIIVFIKQIDKIVISLGFSSSAINLAFYIAVLFLFYLIFKMRLKIVKIEKNITDLARKISLKE